MEKIEQQTLLISDQFPFYVCVYVQVEQSGFSEPPAWWPSLCASVSLPRCATDLQCFYKMYVLSTKSSLAIPATI